MKQTALPDCLRSVPVEVLENYVGSQIAMFANGLAHRLGQHGYHIPTEIYKESAREVFQLLISEPSPRRTATRPQDLQLVFRHDCLALGCLVPSCKLCKHNPSRRCAVNFDKKYLVNDILKAKCQAVIRVEIVERATNQPVEDATLRDDIILQMAILDGNTYDAKFEAGMEGDFESCLLLMNNKGTPTLVGTAVSNDPHGFIRVPLVGSRAVLPDLRVTDSSEAMLSGRKPPLRLMMRAVYKDSLLPVPHIRHAISEGFVVATRRTRTAGKVDIPSVDDHVSKLEHMGRETVKKLSDIMDAAHQAGIEDLHIHSGSNRKLCIETVGAFQQLALAAENDPHLQKRLQQVLKLNKEKWEEARDHAFKAVVVDNRMRVWWASTTNSSSRIGIVFSCTKGTVDLETPIALIQEGGKILFAAEWTQSQLDFVRHLQPMALSHWWQPNHTNWDLLEWDSDVYKGSGQLVKAQIVEPSLSGEPSHTVTIKGNHSLPGPSNRGQHFSKDFSDIERGIKIDISQDKTSPEQRSLPPSHAALRGSNSAAMMGQRSAGAPDLASLAPQHAQGSGASSRGLQTAFNEGIMGGQTASHGPGAPAQLGNEGHSSGIGVFLHTARSEDMPDGAPFTSASHPGLQISDGPAASRLMSGMSVEGLVLDPGAVLMSRNTSGLDTMQSIEHALPDGEQAPHPR